MNKEYKIKLDLNKKLYNKKMTFNQFDENVNDFYIEVTKNNEVIKDLDKSIVTLVAIKPDNAVEAQFVEVENGLVYADLKPSMCDLVGNYQAKAMIVLEGKIITTDTIIYSVNEDKIISRLNEDIVSDERFTLFTDALARLSDIEASEEQRMINEAERILSEENRKIEEAKRVEAELARQHEEADRAKYDATRESNENIRKQNESIRLANETNRIDEEAKRVEEETKRKLAEEERNANYNFMTEDEERRRSEANAHKEAEALRVQAETNRVNEEAKRRTTEQARVSAENTRVSNENTREANEVARQNNENQRVEAETQRQNRYNSFILEAEANANNFENYTNTAKVKEEERKANELDRKSQEARRVSNEVERISNENTRKANENARIETEKQRVDAENLRKEKIIEIQSDYDSLKKVIIDENASANLQNQINQTNSQLEQKATNKDLEVEKSRIDLLTKVQAGETQGNTELLDIRIDKNGTIHDTAGNATRVAILDNNSVSANKIAEEYIDLLQDTKIYINQSQSGYHTDTGLINRVELAGHICTDVIPISLLGDEITIPLDDELKGQSFIFLDENINAYYSKNVNSIKSNTDMQDYLIYNEANKEYKLLIKKYSQNVGRVAYVSFNFLNSRKYIKKLADKKILKWLKVESENLANECIQPKHISNTEYLKDFTTIKNAYISSYTPSNIIYTESDNQVSTQDLDINELSDTLEFKVASTLKGQVIVLKNNLNNYYVSLNANLIRTKEFRQLTGYMAYDDATEIATLDIKKIRAEVGINTISKIVISSDRAENIKGFVYKDLKWLRTPDKTDLKEEKIEIRLLEEYVLLKGVEYNFYTSQTVMCSRKLDEKYMVIWQYNGSGGTVYNDCIRIKETSTGTNYLTLKVFVEENGELTLVDSKTVKINIVENSIMNKKLLFIGDSRIEDGANPWPARVQLVTTIKNILDSSNIFLGTRGGGSLANHEGRSGWRSYDYCMTEYDSKRECSNEFYNPNFTDTLNGLASHFDFSYYMSNKGYDTVDLVGIYLGANDLYDDNSIIYQRMMIKSIKSFNNNIKIILFSDYLSPCDNYSLLPAGLTYIKRRLSQMSYYKKQKQMITDLGFSDVYIIGTNNMIDDWYDFNRKTRKISYRNSDSETIEFIEDGIHPKASGYDKMADLVCGHINYILSNAQ